MPNVDELAELEASASVLVAQNLRSKAVLIERLRPLIDRANSLGHMHARIHEVLSAAGIDMTLSVYMTTLKRVRKRSQVVRSSPAIPVEPLAQTVNASGSQEPKPERVVIYRKPEPEASQTGASDSTVIDAQKALERADAELAGKDYAKIARQLRRKYKPEPHVGDAETCRGPASLPD